MNRQLNSSLNQARYKVELSLEDKETRTDTAFAVDWIDDVAREAAADVALGDVLAEVLTAPDSRAAQRSHRRTEFVVVYKQDKQ